MNSINSIFSYKKQSANAKALHGRVMVSWFVNFCGYFFYLFMNMCDIVLVATSNQIWSQVKALLDSGCVFGSKCILQEYLNNLLDFQIWENRKIKIFPMLYYLKCFLSYCCSYFNYWSFNVTSSLSVVLFVFRATATYYNRHYV